MTSLNASPDMGLAGLPSHQPTDSNGNIIHEYNQLWSATDYRSAGCQNISYNNSATELYKIPPDLKNADVIRNTVLNNPEPLVKRTYQHNVTNFYRGFPLNTRNAA